MTFYEFFFALKATHWVGIVVVLFVVFVGLEALVKAIFKR